MVTLIFGRSSEGISNKTAVYLTKHIQKTWTRSDATCLHCWQESGPQMVWTDEI